MGRMAKSRGTLQRLGRRCIILFVALLIQKHVTHVLSRRCYRPNFLRGSAFFPLSPIFPPRPLPRPRPLLLVVSFLKGTKVLGRSSVDSIWEPETGAIRGSRYFGTCFICGCTRVGCRGLSCRRYSKSKGLSSK